MAKINIGEVLAEGLKAKGIAPDSDAAKKFLLANADLGKLEVEDTAIGDLTLLTFDAAKSNIGLKQHFENQVYGGFATDTEKTFLALAKEYGIEEAEAKKILDDRSIKPWERGAKIAQAIAAKAKESGKGGGNKEQIEALEKKFTDMVTTKDGEISRIKGEYESKAGEMSSRLLAQGLRFEIISGKFGKLNADAPMFEDIVGVIAGKALNLPDYKITQDEHGAWAVLDRKTGTVATDPKTGKEVPLQLAMQSLIPEALLLKDDPNPRRREGENGGKGNSLIDAQRKRMEQANA